MVRWVDAPAAASAAATTVAVAEGGEGAGKGREHCKNTLINSVQFPMRMLMHGESAERESAVRYVCVCAPRRGAGGRYK